MWASALSRNDRRADVGIGPYGRFDKSQFSHRKEPLWKNY